MTTRRRFTADFKAKVALEAPRGEETLQRIAVRSKVHPNQESTWKRQAMDGRGRYMDNTFIERPWRSLKYEAVYPHELTDGFEAGRVIGERVDFYNTERPHSSLGGATPAEAYGAGRPVDMMDKASALPTSSPAQQQHEDVTNKDLAA